MMVFLLVPVELIVVFEMLVTMGAEIGLNISMYSFMTLQQLLLFKGFITQITLKRYLLVHGCMSAQVLQMFIAHVASPMKTFKEPL